MSFKEKLQSLNKKNIAIIAAILFVVAICSICGYEYYQMKHFEATTMAPTEGEPDLSAPEEAAKPEEKAEPTKKPSEYKIGMEYDKAIKANKPVIVLFYADWCHYCIRFMPKYEELSKTYKKDYNFSKVNVEDPKYEKLVNSMGITGFPTVFIIDPKYDNRVLLSNAILGDMKQLQTEVDRFLRIRNLLDSKK